MTTNRSLRKPMLFTFKQGLKSIATAVAVILCGAIGFLTTMYSVIKLFNDRPIYDDMGNLTGYEPITNFYHYIIFEDGAYMSKPLLMIIAAGGVLAAICMFNFITSKKMVNVYYSLGITRTKLFCGKYFSGLLLLTLATFIPMLITFIANVATVGYSATLMKAVLYYLFKFMLTAFTSYTITSAVFAVVGTTFETAIFSAIILFIPDIFLYSIQVLMDKFLYGNPYGNSFLYANEYNYYNLNQTAALSEKFSFLSPVFWGETQMNEIGYMEKNNPKDVIPEISPNFIYALLWLGICVGVFFLAVLFFNKRKAEICGFIGTNRYLNSAVSLLTAFAAFCVAINYFEDFVLGIVLGAVAFAIIHLVLEIIVLRDLKKFVRGLYKLPIGIAVSVAIVFIFNSGFFGFSQKIPDVAEIKSVAITIGGTNAEYGLFNSDSWWSNADYRYFDASGCLAGEFTTENDIKAVVDVHKAITEADEDDRTVQADVQLVYTLKNGEKIRRNFDSISGDAYKKMLYLEDCNFYDEQLKNYFKGDIKKFDNYVESAEYVFAEAQTHLKNSHTVEFYGRYQNKVFTVNLSLSDKEKLLDALYTDLVNRSAEEKYYPAQSPVGFVYFPLSEVSITAEEAPEQSEFTVNDFSSKYQEFCPSSVWQTNFFTYITTDMTNTIQLLKDMGIYEQMTAVPEFVSAEIIDAQTAYDTIINGEYNYLADRYSNLFIGAYSSSKPTNDEGWTVYDKTLDLTVEGKAITDKNVIDELVKCSYSVYAQEDTAKGWFVSFKTADGSTLLCYIPDGKLPASVKQ
ncbi:MAG: hypothetical protein IJZ35_09380 [Clostridia bacterium]|nr:hypothetical protein [Clostridia bacterium]